MIAFEGLEGRSLFSASLAPTGDLISPLPAEGQTFGSAVATKGNLALVGTGMGSAALYDTSTNSLLGTYVDTTDPDGSMGHQFGYSVTFFGSGNSFAIGAPGDNGGKVYVYLTPASSPIEMTATQYVGYNAESWPFMPGFGTALAGYGDHLLVDSALDMNNGGGGTVKEINPTSGTVFRTFANPEAGFLGDSFGSHMAVSGDQILFYAQNLNDMGPGLVYLYDGTDFIDDHGQVRLFMDPTGGRPMQQFGSSMAFDGDTVVIAAPNNDVSEAGVIVGSPVYQFSASSGQLVRAYAQPSTVPTISGFWEYSGWGFGLAISGDHLLIGAPNAFNESQSDFAGQVYAYDLNTGAELAHAVAPDEGGMFGARLAALPDGRFLVADPASNVLGFSAGMAHVYQLTVDTQSPETSPPTAVVPDDLLALIDNTVSFTGADSTADAGATIVSYEWDFNYDGTNFDADASGADASFVYAAAGTYTVALKVTDNHDKTSIATLVVTISLPPAPTADAGGDQAALNGASVSLGGTGAGTGTLTYEWDYNNDGTFDATGANASMAFATSGAHTVAFRVTDAYGQSAVDTLVVTTAAPAPTANAGDDLSATAGTGVAFHGVAAAGLGATIASYEWDFDNDGTFDATGADASYVYLTAGAHTVAFRVTDSDGNTVTDTAVVTVTAAAPTAEAGTDVAVIAGNAVALHGVATAGTGGSVASVEWDFNYDGTFDVSATGADASVVYTTAGAHTVAFRVTGSDGQSTIDTVVVTVAARPPAADAGANQSVQTGQAVALHGTATAGLGSGIAAIAWDFNYDGITFDVNATGADASTVYTAAGTYTVAFRVTGADGQISIDTATVTVTTPTPPTPPVVVVGGQVQVTGTASNDTISLDHDGNGNVLVSFNGTTYGPFARRSTVVINGGAGNDVITGLRKVNADLVIYGGAGNDTITGGGGADLLIGGDGNDTLIAGTDRDIIIGGAGADNLQGKAGQDIVIAGWTVFDSNPTALNALLAEWTSGRTFDKRIANLRNGTGSADRLNGSYFLAPGSTVFDDAIVDTLSGGGGKDWMIFNATGSGVRDILTDSTGADVITDL